MTVPTDRFSATASDPAIAAEPRRLAAIDLGSNSFHLLVANYQDDRLQVVARLGEKVQLAAGLDEEGLLREDAMTRALDCLARFAPSSRASPAATCGSSAPMPCATRATARR